MPTVIRTLTADDAASFQALRLRSLKDHPEAFGSAYEDEKDTPLSQTIDFLSQPIADRFIIGAFVDDTLVGIVAAYRDGLRKSKHRGHIGAMYVTPEARGHGIGRLLLTDAIAHLRAIDGIEEITLAVTVGNDSARALYASAGFESAYIEPRFFKIDGVYYDLDWMILRFKQP
jgi:ribosomal protein S18 acetylase RimI-like enzyme